MGKFRRRYIRVNGQKAKIVGHIGLMHTIADVTDISCNVGDRATMDVNPVDVKKLPVTYVDGGQVEER